MNTASEFNKSKLDIITSDEELRKCLDSIIDNKYKHHISDWIYYAKPNEKKGLYIMSKVIKYKGQKLFKTQLTKTKEEENDVTKLTLEEAFKRYQKRKIISSYSEFYGGNLDDKYKYNNILKYKDFENLNYAEIIKKENHAYIQAWVNIEKTEQYKEYVLDFIRSFLSTVRSNAKFVTHNNEYFKTFKNTDKFTSHAPFAQTKTNVKFQERTLTLEEMRERLNLNKILPEPEDVQYNDNIQNQEEIKKRKMELVNGHKNLLKGIYNGSNSSNYQEVFKGLPVKYPYSFKNDFYSSGIKGISPDPLTVKRLNANLEINDDLKNTVKTIMFSDNYNNSHKFR